MESAFTTKKRKKLFGTFDDGTLSYKATQAAALPSTGATLQGTSSGVDTTTPFSHAPATQMYWNPETVDRSGYREEGRKQYGVGSDFYKGLDEQGKLDFINKIGGQVNGIGGNAFQSKMALSDKIQDRLKTLAAASPKFGYLSRAAEAMRKIMIDKAYAGAAGRAYGLRGISDKTILSQLGKAAPHTEWREVFDNFTGKSLGYYQDDQKSGRGGWWDQSMARNPDAMQAGIGALSGLVVGGIPGAIVGGATGWYQGDQVKQQNEAQDKLVSLQNRQNILNNINPNRPRMLRDVARSRAAGAGTFNYTDQVEG